MASSTAAAPDDGVLSTLAIVIYMVHSTLFVGGEGGSTYRVGVLLNTIFFYGAGGTCRSTQTRVPSKFF